MLFRSRRAEGRQEAEKRLKKEHPKRYRFLKVENVAESLSKSCRNVCHFYVFSENAQMSETICFPIENVVPDTYNSITNPSEIDAKSMSEKDMQKLRNIMEKRSTMGWLSRHVFGPT